MTPALETAILQQESTADDANETVRHHNPDEYDEAGDAAELERWLSNHLSDRLESSAVEISDGEYDLASEYVGEEYRERFEQYVEVTGDGAGGPDGGDEGGNTTVDSFTEAQAEQEQLAETLAAYNETKDAYEEAREDGDRERARELARELVALAEDIEGSNQELQTHFDVIGENTDTELSEPKAELEATNRDVQAERTQIRTDEFVDTELTVASPSADPISFTEPLVSTGELRTANGTPVANEDIRLAIGNQTIATETDATGAFEFEYRPVSVPLDADSVTVRYVPESDAVYFGSETNVSVSVEQVEPTIADPTVDPERVAYGDEITVESGLHVDTVGADGAPLAVSIGDEPIGINETTNGTFVGSATVPADVPAGERSLRVRLPFEDRALEAVQTSTTVTVTETEPDLSLSATRTGERDVRVNGSLVAAGDGLEGHSIRLDAEGTTLETVPTDEQGSFSGVLTLPADVATGDVQLTAVYDDDGTNIAPAETATTVPFGSGSTAWSVLPVWAWVGLGLLVVTAGGIGVRWYRHSGVSEPESPPNDGEADGTDEAISTAATTDSIAASLLSQADDRRSNGDLDGAVRTAYAAVRRTLEPQLDATQPYTHWEFYRQYRTTVADRPIESLRDVTEGYELAAFGRDAVSESEVETVLERARRICDVEERSGTTRTDGGTPPADE